ncbi:hypothetical protein CNR22_08190 [Sphingobacteriaceae bacterium]|nr:hypothetical protein CNR22_08190 [Sphingobacteriaceae bacterium]
MTFSFFLTFSDLYKMIIGIAGPYSASTPEQRQKNLDVLNHYAAKLLAMGHIPLIGVNAALPILPFLKTQDTYTAIMTISLAMINSCEALLVIAESPGANKERDLILAKGLPVFYSLEEIPSLN